MSNTSKRILGDYIVNTIDETNAIAGTVTFNTTKVNINGDLDVFGTLNRITEQELDVLDKTITLNSGNTDAGIQGAGPGDHHAGLEVDRGTFDNVGLRYNEEADPAPGVGLWEITNDGTTWYPILTQNTFTGLENVVEDLTPQLGGDLDVNGFRIGSVSDGDVIIYADGFGQVKVNHPLSLEREILTPAADNNYNKVYAQYPDSGGSGIFFVSKDAANNTVQDELVSKSKAIVYSIIF